MTLAAPPPTRVDRDEVFLEHTKSICPVCKAVIDAEINVRDNKVFIRKRCRDHGPFEALLYGDAEMYVDMQRFNKPGTLPLQTQTEVRDGCPLDCGLCPDHKQHACLGIIEVNTACNLDCPVCFADSGHQPDGFSLSLDQVEAGLDAFVAAEGEPEVVMFSGGEPSIHPQILEFCAMARDKGVRTVVLNTNGIRLAHDRSFAPALAELGVKIYLQFDGLEEATHVALRGRDLRAAKAQALDRYAEVGLTVLLVAAVEAEVNTHELGAVVRHGIAHPAVRGVVFQPVTHAGRHTTFDPRQRLTNADVIHGLVDQCPDWFRTSDFFPVPCCSPTCRSITYLLTGDDDVVPIPPAAADGELPRLPRQPRPPGPGPARRARTALERVGGPGHRRRGKPGKRTSIRNGTSPLGEKSLHDIDLEVPMQERQAIPTVQHRDPIYDVRAIRPLDH